MSPVPKNNLVQPIKLELLWGNKVMMLLMEELLAANPAPSINLELMFIILRAKNINVILFYFFLNVILFYFLVIMSCLTCKCRIIL
jgi:hypothetical protein